MYWNSLDDTCTELISIYEEVTVMNAQISDINSLIQIYISNAPYMDKSWRKGFRQALFICLDSESYEKFVYEVSKLDLFY